MSPLGAVHSVASTSPDFRSTRKNRYASLSVVRKEVVGVGRTSPHEAGRALVIIWLEKLALPAVLPPVLPAVPSTSERLSA